MPQDPIDPVVIGAQLVLALGTIVSRSVDPSHMVVVNVGTFQAGEAATSSPTRPSSASRSEPRIRLTASSCTAGPRTSSGKCDTYEATYDLDWILGYGIVHNAPDLADLAV